MNLLFFWLWDHLNILSEKYITSWKVYFLLNTPKPHASFSELLQRWRILMAILWRQRYWVMFRGTPPYLFSTHLVLQAPKRSPCLCSMHLLSIPLSAVSNVFLKKSFSCGRDFLPLLEGDWWHVGTFLVINTGREYINGIWWVEVRDAAKPPETAQDSVSQQRIIQLKCS